MPDGSALVYLYDGTLDGLLCCASESLAKDETPAELCLASDGQCTLYETKEIESDAARANALLRTLRKKAGPDAVRLVKRAFLTCLERREAAILLFIRLALRAGPRVLTRLTDPAVEPLLRAVRYLGCEVEKYMGFVRFSDLGGVLVSVIAPENQVLPVLARHFADRYPEERILLYDKNHRAFLLCEKGEIRLGYMDAFTPAAAGRGERNYRALWQSFYETIAIPARYNPRCRMGNMPKRYWAEMTEFWEREVYRPEELPEAGETGLPAREV